MVAHTCNPSTWEAETGGSHRFKASLSYLVRLSATLVRSCFQIKYKLELDMVVHACNPRIREAATGGSWFKDSLNYLVRPSATQ